MISIYENSQPASTNIQYNHRNLPLSFVNRNGHLVTYRYDADEQRIFKKVGSMEAEHYIMDGDQNLAVLVEGGSLRYWNIFGNGLAGRMDAAGDKFYYLKDHLGSTRAVIKSDGTVVEAHDYYPFGLQMPGRSYQTAERTKELFTGKERDVETGWDYFGARYYSPALGRWLSVDPLASKYPSWSPYNYAINNPVRFIDPDGKLLYDMAGNRINLDRALSLFNQGVDAFFSGDQQNAVPNFYAKAEWRDYFDTEDWRHGQVMSPHSILVGRYNLYDSQGKSLQSAPAILIDYASQGGYMNSTKLEFVAYTKNGKKIYRFSILDEKGQTVFAILGTKEELDRYLGLFGRNTSNSQVWYENGKQYGQQLDDKPTDNNEDDKDEEEKRKNNNSWFDGWGAQNQGPPR